MFSDNNLKHSFWEKNIWNIKIILWYKNLAIISRFLYVVYTIFYKSKLIHTRIILVDVDIPTFDNIMDDIFNDYERFTRDNLYSHH